MIREEGFYWVLYDNLTNETGWQVGFYSDGNWELVGIDFYISEDELQQINETKLIQP